MQRIVLLTALLLAGMPEEPAPAPRRLPSPHRGGRATEQAVLDVTLAFLREDLAAARPALDRIEAGCKRLGEDDRAVYGGEVLAYDRAFHAALDVSREMASAGDVQRSWEQFVWVSKGCRACHALARSAPNPPKANAH